MNLFAQPMVIQNHLTKITLHFIDKLNSSFQNLAAEKL